MINCISTISSGQIRNRILKQLIKLTARPQNNHRIATINKPNKIRANSLTHPLAITITLNRPTKQTPLANPHTLIRQTIHRPSRRQHILANQLPLSQIIQNNINRPQRKLRPVGQIPLRNRPILMNLTKQNKLPIQPGLPYIHQKTTNPPTLINTPPALTQDQT